MDGLSSLLIAVLFSLILTYQDMDIIISIAEISLHHGKFKKIRKNNTIIQKVTLSSFRKYVPLFFYVWYYVFSISRIICIVVLLILTVLQTHKINTDIFILYFGIQALPSIIIFGPGRGEGTQERKKKCLKRFSKKDYKYR